VENQNMATISSLFKAFIFELFSPHFFKYFMMKGLGNLQRACLLQ